ncbi:signal peptide peptidase-like protein 2 [Tanacetum coccineum]
MLVLYCWRAKEEDLKVARMINKLCVKLSAEIEEHRMFTQEFDASPGWVIIKGKTSEFLQELAKRDEERGEQLHRTRTQHTYTHTEHKTEHNTNTTSTSNAPLEAAVPTKDDMEGLLEMMNKELFPACTWMSSLEFLAKFEHLKVLHKWTDTSFDETMEFLLKSFPTGAKLPKSYYEAKKSMKKVRLGYESIDACINDCCLFWGKDNKDEEICPICKASRWKNKDTTGKKAPNKVLRYFPLIPRLKGMYGSLHTAKHMTWHATRKCTEDGKMDHPVDGKAWKEFDKNNSEFAKEHRNPLVKELKTLWKKPGVKTLDVATNTEFSMRAVLLWTISDFPARSSLSGWSGQDYLAYPTCNEETPSTRVNGKTAYVGHRRFLPIQHRWRNDKTFNEAILGGPVYMRWMYPFERYMKKLKNYVRNKARPEGCIAEGYIAEEALTFCSHYLRNVPTKFNRPDRNDDGPPPTSELPVFRSACTPKSAGVGKKLDHEVKKKLVWYVLNNSPEIDQYKTECCLAMPENDLPTKFSPWFRDKISTLYTKNPSECSLELFALASEPKDHATYYTSCIVNGVKFVVRSRDERLITQNSGVSTPGENGSMFYGLLEEIVELNYLTHQKVVLFRCKWFKTNNTRSTSLCVTKNNITSISTRDEWWKENQYILATQARQVFYLEDPSRSHHWKVVQEVNHRKIWDKDVIVDADVVHDSNSSDVALTANLEDLEYTRLSGAGPSTEVSFIPTSRVNDDDFIDDDVEYDAVHVLSSDSEDEDSD